MRVIVTGSRAPRRESETGAMRAIVAGCLAPPKGSWLNDNGYFRVPGHQYAHRVAYEGAHGPIPTGLVIDHLCRVRWCCNPEHLEAVTDKVNILRGESPPARNARKTHCERGHELTAKAGGGRHCATCRRVWRIAHGEINPRGPKSERTECPQGHPYDEENTHVVHRGDRVERHCRACARERARIRRAA